MERAYRVVAIFILRKRASETSLFVGAAVVGGERVAILTGWAAFDRPPMGAGIEGRVIPGTIFSHWSFDAKEPLVVIGDDQEERFRVFSIMPRISAVCASILAERCRRPTASAPPTRFNKLGKCSSVTVLIESLSDEIES
jgi:hypothetical protein